MVTGVVVMLHVVLVVCVLRVLVASLADEVGRNELHPALGTLVGSVAGDFGVHGAGVGHVGRPAVARSAMPHFGQRPGSSLTTSGCIGQA